MNVLKRLLNVLTIVAVVVFFTGIKTGVEEYQQKTAERNQACQRAAVLEKVKNRTSTNPFWKFVPDTEGKTIDELLEETRANCSQDVDWIQQYGSAKTVIGSSAAFAIFVLVLNYIFFGSVTLWNRK